MSPPPLKAIDARGAALALLLSLLWGANPVAIKIGLADAPPIRLAWMRFVVGGLVVLAWGWATGRLQAFRIERDEWRPLFVVGLLFTAQIGSMNIGTSLTTAAHATVLLNLYAVHTVVLSHLMIPGDRLTTRRSVGVLIAYAGIVVLFRGQVGADSSGRGDRRVQLRRQPVAARALSAQHPRHALPHPADLRGDRGVRADR